MNPVVLWFITLAVETSVGEVGVVVPDVLKALWIFTVGIPVEVAGLVLLATFWFNPSVKQVKSV